MKKGNWLNLSTAGLLVLLQRAPVLRVSASAGEFIAQSRIVSLLKSAFTMGASLGAVNALAGATQFVVSNRNVSGTVGTAITPVAFTVTGAAIPAGSFRITGALPPGLSVPNANSSGVLNGSSGTITGTPTTPGNYTVSILAYERTNASGDSFGPTQIGFTITGTATAAPAISTQPASQSVQAGSTVILSVIASGSPAPTYQWRKNGVLLAGATNAALVLPNAQAADVAAYTVVVANSVGIVSSNAATLAVTTASTAAPTVATQPQSQYVASGAMVTFTVGSSNPDAGIQWKKDDVPISGATSPTYTIPNASVGSMGFYSATLTAASGSTTSAVAILTVNTGGTSRLINVSTRGYVPAGGSLTPGFVLQGTANKSVLIRAVGPTLGSFGVGGTLADPMMEVIPLGSSIAIAANDNWGGSSALQTAFSRVGAFPFAALSSTDASVETALPSAGASGYTVRITSQNSSAAGIALAEVYDEDSADSAVRLINVSTNGFVGTGEQALVPGFVIGGIAPKLLLIRAVGPGLTQFGVNGVLADPQLSLVPHGKDQAVAANDNWPSSPDAAALQSAFTQAGAFALANASKDAAVIVRLPPGGYSVVVSGVANTTGTALVEVYDLDR